MRRFWKILTLILALAAILTVFAVVALADEPQTVQPAATQVDFDHANWYLGRSWDGTVRADDVNYIKVQQAYEGGNKFLHLTGSKAGSTQYLTFFRNISTDELDFGIRDMYLLGSYPIVALDFDLMTPNGDWGLFSADNFGNSAGITFSRVYIGGSEKSNFPATQISFGNLGLAATPHVWHHVTVIYELIEKTVDGSTNYYLKQTTYADGELVTNAYCTTAEGSEKNLTALYGEDAVKIWVGPLTIQAAAYETAPFSQQAIDNINITYAQAGCDTSNLVDAIYNDSWEAPIGQAIASVTTEKGEVYYFVDINEAADFTKENPGSEISLAGDITAPFLVDTEFTINAGSYTGVEQYARTTKGYYLEETEEGSGIYQSKIGNVALIDTAGNMTAYPESKFVTACANAQAGYTVKLLSDIETDVQILPTVAYTLDLNGKTLKRIYYSGNKYQATKDESTGDFIFGKENAETVPALSAAEESFIKMNSNFRLYFKVTSSVEGGAVYNVTATADTWYYNGEVVKRENIANITPKAFATHIEDNGTLDVSNISVYAATFVNSAHASIDNVVTKIDNCNYYHMGGGNAYAFYSLTKDNYTLDVSNSLLYFHVKDDILVQFKNESNSGTKTVVNFENCDIIKTNTSTGYNVAFYRGSKSPEYITTTVDNCRIWDIDFNAAFTKFKDGSLYREDGSQTVEPAFDEPYTKQSVYFTKSYTLPATQNFISKTDGDVEYVSISDTTVLDYAFNRIITKPVDINWLDVDGVTVVATTQLTPGVSKVEENAYRYVKELADNDYLNALCQWTDKEGKAIGGVLGVDADALVKWPSNDSYTFYAKETLNGVTNYVGGIKKVNFNLNFLSGFRYNLYIPVDERLTEMAVEGFDVLPNTVLIGGEEYTVYSKIVGTAAAAEANVISATFKVDGVAYSQSWSINAVQYAQWLIKDPIYESEKAAAVKMIKFIKEAVLDTPESTVDTAALDAIVTAAGFETTYNTYNEGDKDALLPLADYINSAYFIVYNGVVAYEFDVVEGAEISFNNGDIATTVVGTKVTLEAMRIYDLIDPITIAVGETSVEFSILDYLTAMEGEDNMELAKALYEFGVAADAYKADIMANGNFAN